MLNDTIAAISTPSGRAGIGVIRVSGQYAIEVAQIVTGKELKDRAPALCNIRDRNNQVLDEVIVILYAAPRSYTGENLIEIQCHGNPIILNEIIALCCAVSFPGGGSKHGRVDTRTTRLIGRRW